MNDKIQTGLRLPIQLYDMLTKEAERNGLSINAQVLMLIDIGLRAINLGIQQEAHVLSRKQQDIAE